MSLSFCITVTVRGRLKQKKNKLLHLSQKLELGFECYQTQPQVIKGPVGFAKVCAQEPS